MINKTLIAFATLLSDHLKRKFELDEGVVELQPLHHLARSAPDNKIHVTLVNVERETAGGIAFAKNSISGSYVRSGTPDWLCNLYVLVSAAFSEKQYEESLRLLSEVILCLQANLTFEMEPAGQSVTVEPVNLSLHELSNLWGICGGSYYPSLLCKIRVVNLNAEQVQKVQRVVSRKEVKL